MSLNLCSIYW